MNNSWILAQSQATEPKGAITSDQPGGQPLTTQGQTEYQSTTKQPAPNAAPENAPAKKPPAGVFNLFLIGAMFILLYLVVFRGPRKKQQQQRQMIQSLKKNDKVRTIGGIIGTIIDIKDDEITLKVDESNNTKIKVVPGAVSKNVSQD